MTSSRHVDVVVAGDGLVGLACANALAAREIRVCVVGRRRAGFASTAAAGILAPTIDPAHASALRFALAGRDRYRDFVDGLVSSTGRAVPLDFDGILRLPSDEIEAATMASVADGHSTWITASDVRQLEPALVAPLGARFHQSDGIVDNVRLLDALEHSLTLGGVPRVTADIDAIELTRAGARLTLGTGARVTCDTVVLATGAWTSLIRGLPRPLPIAPLRGQMMALAGSPVHRPIFGFGGYLAPRPLDKHVIVGSTAEAVGFDAGTTDSALQEFRSRAARLAHPLGRADEIRSWSGLRPMTVDGQPIIGRDPEHPALVYACGHSRNGVLLAPITSEVVCELITGRATSIDLSPFAITRFPAQIRQFS